MTKRHHLYNFLPQFGIIALYVVLEVRIVQRYIREFRDGILSSHTRRFGNVAEIMIAKLYNLDDSHSLAYDKYNPFTEERIEIKFSTVMKRNSQAIRSSNIIEQIAAANVSNRTVSYDNAETTSFDCNIQQVKCSEFDLLYYGLFFSDAIEIFQMTSDDVLKLTGYSNKQHRGNTGEGQFHITNSNIQYHRDNFFERLLSYEELYDLLNQ